MKKTTIQMHPFVSPALKCLEGKTYWSWDQGEFEFKYLSSGDIIFGDIFHRYLCSGANIFLGNPFGYLSGANVFGETLYKYFCSGAGKTSLLRVLRGLWPGGQGVVAMVGGDQVGSIKESL